VSIEFGPGFTVLTGETGAGKSILIDGLNLALGERADRELIRTGCDESKVEALFDLEGMPGAAERLAGMEVPLLDGELLLRRVITAAGKSRCSVNGSPMPLVLMKKLGDILVDLHGQHEHQLLLDEASHLEFLDAFGRLGSRRDEVREAHGAWKGYVDEMDRLKTADRGKAETLDLLNFQINEISAAKIEPGEEARLVAERNRLAHAQKLLEALGSARDALVGENGARDHVGRAAAAIRSVASFDPDAIDPAVEALGRLNDTVQSSANDLRGIMESLEADPGRLDAVEERLDLIGRLKRKYGGSEESLIEHLEKSRKEAAELAGAGERLAEMAERLEKARCLLSDRAASLSGDRNRVSETFASRVAKELAELAMGAVDFGVKLSLRGDPDGPVSAGGNRYLCTPEGIDSVRFYIAPNVGESTKPLKSVASGGELSRIMLALKSVLGSVDRVGTVVFDEIDAGIGGRVAEVVGRKLGEIGGERQVLCITHLPQIAARAAGHFVVRKKESHGHTVVEAEKLSGKKRIEELARMLAGEDITPTALRHAEALLKEE